MSHSERSDSFTPMSDSKRSSISPNSSLHSVTDGAPADSPELAGGVGTQPIQSDSIQCLKKLEEAMTNTRASLWLPALGRDPKEVTGTANVVCSLHFRNEDIIQRGSLKTLKRGAVPTLFLGSTGIKDASDLSMPVVKKTVNFQSEVTYIENTATTYLNLPSGSASPDNSSKTSSKSSSSSKKRKLPSSTDSEGLRGSPKKRRRILRTYHNYKKKGYYKIKQKRLLALGKDIDSEGDYVDSESKAANNANATSTTRQKVEPPQKQKSSTSKEINSEVLNKPTLDSTSNGKNQEMEKEEKWTELVTKKKAKINENTTRGTATEDSKRSGAGSDEIHSPTLWYFNLLMFTIDQELPTKSISNIEEEEKKNCIAEETEASEILEEHKDDGFERKDTQIEADFGRLYPEKKINLLNRWDSFFNKVLEIKKTELNTRDTIQDNILSILESLENLSEGILKSIQDYHNQSYVFKNSEFGEVNYKNLLNGSIWEGILNSTQGKYYIPLLVYFDDFETSNPLGSHAGVYKVGAVYFSIASLLPEYISRLENIFVTVLFHSSERTEFGNASVFNCLLEDLKNLEFAAVTKQQTQLIDTHDRSEAKYDKHVREKQYGIKANCIWNELKYFHVYQNQSVDLMHDLYEVNEIDEEAISLLTESEIAVLIPQIGKRLKFNKKWKEHFQVKNNSSLIGNLGDISLENLPIFINNIEENKEENNIYISHQRHFQNCCQQHQVHQLMTIQELLFHLMFHQFMRITKERFLKLAQDICQLFPGESSESYYISSYRNAKGASVSAHGKLYDRYSNQRCKFQRLELIPRKSKKHKASDQKEEDIEVSEDSISWLKNNSQPWPDVLNRWKVTSKVRLHRFYHSTIAIHEFMKLYPALTEPLGYSLPGPLSAPDPYRRSSTPQPGPSSAPDPDRQPSTPQPGPSSAPDQPPSAGKVLEHISPLPTIPQGLKKRSRSIATLLTSTENIEKAKLLKQRQVKRKGSVKPDLKLAKKAKKVKPRMSSSESDEEYEAKEDSDNDIDDEINENECAGCLEDYNSTTRSDDWICCVLCSRWMHENCTKHKNMCDLCGKRTQKTI
ncbi:unnamed protein product [Brassicogethes aeneus]|uniref:THAP-type domain-containing protein n=1 Tax=Brassicogethes aeneus TaxID=1431903 RepID=A0A9P0BD99_BRAAE|nr:unnamed protein product [Brassicogethes aeneus]